MYCKFQDTGEIYNNKKLYICNNCGMKVGLENPDAKIICFPLSREALDHRLSEANINPVLDRTPRVISNEEDRAKVLKNARERGEYDYKSNDLCSDDEIKDRLAICNQCEYYENDACNLCGCVIVREKNYKNKLAMRNASCPDNRWGPVS